MPLLPRPTLRYLPVALALAAMAAASQATVTRSLSADCGLTARVFAAPGAVSIGSDCRDQAFDPVLREAYDYRIYASTASIELAGDGPTLYARSLADIQYFDLKTKGAGTGSTGSSPANANGQTESAARLVFDIAGAQPGDVYTLRTQLYVGGHWSFAPQGDPFAPFERFVDGYLQVKGDWSSSFGTPVDGTSWGNVLYQVRPTGIEGGGSLPNGVIVLERSIRAGEVGNYNVWALADTYLKNNYGTQSGNGQVGIGSGAFSIEVKAGVAGFQVFQSSGAGAAPLDRMVAAMVPVDFSVTTAEGLPFVYYTPAVPEPESVALMLAGLGLVAGLVRRRRPRT